MSTQFNLNAEQRTQIVDDITQSYRQLEQEINKLLESPNYIEINNTLDEINIGSGVILSSRLAHLYFIKTIPYQYNTDNNVSIPLNINLRDPFKLSIRQVITSEHPDVIECSIDNLSLNVRLIDDYVSINEDALKTYNQHDIVTLALFLIDKANTTMDSNTLDQLLKRITQDHNINKDLMAKTLETSFEQDISNTDVIKTICLELFKNISSYELVDMTSIKLDIINKIEKYLRKEVLFKQVFIQLDHY